MNRWENIGDKYLLNALGDDPLAASQSVAMYLDPIGKCIEWHTNGHAIRMRPDLPSAVISGPFPTAWGYEWNLAGGIVFGIGDVSLTKRAGILDQWGLQGVQIYYIVPVGQIPNIPIVTIEKIDILDGMIDSLILAPQGIKVQSAEAIAAGMPPNAPWVDNSMAIHWADKAHNNSLDNHSNYMAGKVNHEGPPLAHPLVCADLQAGNTANRSFGAAGGSETIGWYEVLSGGFQKAFNHQDLADRRGVGTHYAFAATLGYTSIGGSNSTLTTQHAAYCGAMPEDGVVDFYNFAYVVGRGTPTAFGMYLSPTSATPAGTSPSESIDLASHSGGWNRNASVTNPSLTSGDHVWVAGVGTQTDFLAYDSGGSRTIESIGGGASTLPDPWGAGITPQNGNGSAYIEYTPGGGASIIPQIMHHRRQMRH